MDTQDSADEDLNISVSVHLCECQCIYVANASVVRSVGCCVMSWCRHCATLIPLTWTSCHWSAAM